MANEKVDELWEEFEKLSDTDKLDWVLQFDIIYEIVKDWEDDILDDQIAQIKKMNEK